MGREFGYALFLLSSLSLSASSSTTDNDQVDTLGPLEPLLQIFKPYFENPKISKVWHNYGFDRHILYSLSLFILFSSLLPYPCASG
jgi:hypothetical protein